jgi:hypothetical protein
MSFLDPLGPQGEPLAVRTSKGKADEVPLKREDLAVVAEKDQRIERLAGVVARRYCGAREGGRRQNRSHPEQVSVIPLHRFDVLIQVADAQLYFGGVSLAHTPEQFAPNRHLLRAVCREACVTRYRASNAIEWIAVVVLSGKNREIRWCDS